MDLDNHSGFGSASFRDLWDDFELRNDMPVFWEHNLESLGRMNEMTIGLGETKSWWLLQKEFVYKERLIIGENRERQKRGFIWNTFLKQA